MAKSVDKITLLLNLKGFKAVKGLDKDFKKFKSTVKLSAVEVDKAVKGLTKFHGNTKLSTNALKGQIASLERLKDNVGINTKAYKALSNALTEARTKFDQLTGAAQKQQRFGAVGAAGTAALGLAGGYLGSSLGLNPAITGLGLAGASAYADYAKKPLLSGAGLKGFGIGAGIGTGVVAVGALVASARAAAEYSAQIRRLEVALKGVTKSQVEFNKAQEIIRSVSKELNVPIADATQQFTTLTASVIGAGGSVDEAEKVFRGVSEAIKATGGDAEDVKSAIRAMSQIFGKGKVSAEELQGQLGERLPGAVTKFAAATGRNLPQLQKDLRDGTVGLNDVMKFVVKLSEDHREAAREMAKSSADAGQRMRVTFDELKKNVGDVLQPLGAEVQNFAEVAIDNLNRFINKMKEALKIGNQFEDERLEREAKRLEKILGKRSTTGAGDFIGNLIPGLSEFKAFQGLGNKVMSDKQKKIYESQLENIRKKQAERSLTKMIQGMAKSDFAGSGSSLLDKDEEKVFDDPIEASIKNDVKKARDILDKYRDSVKNVNQQIANSFVSTFKKMEDALVDFVLTGTLNFRKLAQSIIADLTRIFIRSQIMGPLTGLFGNMFRGSSGITSFGQVAGGAYGSMGSVMSSTGGLGVTDIIKNAKGNVFAKNKIVPYRMGGVIDSPHIFPMKNGMGLAGEAGAEGILPLKRGRDGKLGVIANGGGVGNIVVNVDASGSSVQGDSAQSEEFGRALAGAIQSEIIQQQRPGGLLA